MKTAEERGSEMMEIPMGKLPPLALEFAKKLCQEVGMCGEVLLTAYTVYAQCVERLPCSDTLYQARPQDVEWFQTRPKPRKVDPEVDLLEQLGREFGEPGAKFVWHLAVDYDDVVCAASMTGTAGATFDKKRVNCPACLASLKLFL